MADESILKKFQLQATCSMCLEYFVEPVLLECGHNFCHHCIAKYWKEFIANKYCPYCKVVVKSGSFFPNRPLENISVLLKQLRDQAKEAEEGEKVCEIHRAPLESFCMSDKGLVCLLCIKSVEHQGHSVVPVEQAALDFKADSVKQDIKAKFKKLHQILLHREEFLMGKIQGVVKMVECKKDSHLNKFFWEISSDAWIMRRLKQKCCQPTHQCLQDVKHTLDRFGKTSTFECPEPFSPRDKLPLWDLLDINVSLGLAMKLIKDILEPELELQEVTLDLQTAHPRLILSEDCKSVRLGDECQDLPMNPERFDASFFVLGCEQCTTGRRYWDVVLGSKGDWAVGVARKSMRRKEPVSISSRSGIWAIGKQADQYVFFDSPNSIHLTFKGELTRVRVFLNCVGRVVAFFDGEGGEVLHQTMLTAAPKEIFVPFFHLGLKAVLSVRLPEPTRPPASASFTAVPEPGISANVLQSFCHSGRGSEIRRFPLGRREGAMAAVNILQKLQEKLTCSICLKGFLDPATLDCGHNFCHSCLVGCWGCIPTQTTCPQCKEVLPRPIFTPNRQLANIVMLTKEMSDRAKRMASSSYSCEQHPEAVTSFCKDDLTPICSICDHGFQNHHAHDIIPVAEAAQTLKVGTQAL
ncbi:zinc finger protein RFP-like [Elgaria multicarinata webbii]|uniref:zinc finger protein RFP-like n=1 Tax=Elgaria multicarinata webbii TaxID=159646 RepID=UPI002FCD095C